MEEWTNFDLRFLSGHKSMSCRGHRAGRLTCSGHPKNQL
jgi:hypothetical protein